MFFNNGILLCHFKSGSESADNLSTRTWRCFTAYRFR